MSERIKLIIIGVSLVSLMGFAKVYDNYQKDLVASNEADRLAAQRADEEDRQRFTVIARQREIEAKAEGTFCSSAWDGSAKSLVDAVKETLRDPGSFEHDETWFGRPDERGRVKVKMVFRSKNGFGGYTPAEATGWVDQTDCSAVVENVASLG